MNESYVCNIQRKYTVDVKWEYPGGSESDISNGSCVMLSSSKYCNTVGIYMSRSCSMQLSVRGSSAEEDTRWVSVLYKNNKIATSVALMRDADVIIPILIYTEAVHGVCVIVLSSAIEVINMSIQDIHVGVSQSASQTPVTLVQLQSSPWALNCPYSIVPNTLWIQCDANKDNISQCVVVEDNLQSVMLKKDTRTFVSCNHTIDFVLQLQNVYTRGATLSLDAISSMRRTYSITLIDPVHIMNESVEDLYVQTCSDTNPLMTSEMMIRR